MRKFVVFIIASAVIYMLSAFMAAAGSMGDAARERIHQAGGSAVVWRARDDPAPLP